MGVNMTKKENEDITPLDCEISIHCNNCSYFDECSKAMENNDE